MRRLRIQVPVAPFRMAYERYKNIRAKKEFYADWEKDNIVKLTNKLRDYVYNKYETKCRIFQRDNFTCQNKDCKICHNVREYTKLTWHHIKAQRNKKYKEEHNARNGVTLCSGIHQKYEKAKGELVFSKDAFNLPPHIRGHTFKLEKPSELNWKKIKFSMRQLRKELKAKGIRPTFDWNEIEILMKWLFIPYDEFDE